MTLLAGYAHADITPPGRADLCGFVAREQPSTKTTGRIMARVIVLSLGRTRAVIAACDLIGFSVDHSRQLERAIAKATSAPARNVFLSCTHQHSGPMSMPLGSVGWFNAAIIKSIERALVDAAKRAAQSIVPVTAITHGRTAITDMGEYRCVTHRFNRQHWPGELQAILIERDDAPPIAIGHTGIHPYLLGPKSRMLHPDFPGPACDHIASAVDGHALFLAGCGADISPVPGMSTSLQAVDRYGKKIAAAFKRAIEHGDAIDPHAVKATVTTPRVRFGFVPPMDDIDENEPAMRAMAAAGERIVKNYREWKRLYERHKLPRTAPFPIHQLRIGDLLLIGMPAEIFYDTGLDLIKARPRLRLLPCAHVGGNLGYLPRPFAYTHKTYEAADAFHWYRTPGAFAPQTEARLRRAALQNTPVY